MADRKSWEYVVANVVAFDAGEVENHKIPIAAASADWWWKQQSGIHRLAWWQGAWWPIQGLLDDAGVQGWELGGVTPPDYQSGAALAYPNYFLILKRTQ